ncbi:MAG: hypothetical protein V5A76_02780 [Candidatus Thermoplasmatota archaeon]
MSVFTLMFVSTTGTGGIELFAESEDLGVDERYPENDSVGVELDDTMGADLNVSIIDDIGNNVNVTFYGNESGETLDQITTMNNLADGDWANDTWEGLEYGTEYEWYVNVTEYENEEVNYTESEEWTFTTEHIPNKVRDPVMPVHEAEGVMIDGMNTTLSVNVKHPEGKDMNVTFYGNMTGENMEMLGQNTSIASGNYANFTWENLSYGTQYTWYVNVTEYEEEDVNYTESSKWNFTTEYNPNKPELERPEDESVISIDPGMNTTLEVNLAHPTGKNMNVTFYDGDGVEIGNVINVGDGLQDVTWENLEYGTEYSWYVNVTEYGKEDMNYTKSSMWTFTTEEEYFSLTIDSTEGGEVVDPSEGTDNYVNGTIVDLEAVSNEGYHFVEWTGDNGKIADTTSNQTTIEMLDNYEITAEFAEVPQVYFEVEIIDYDEDVNPGDYLMVEFTIENTGGIEGTQNITLSVDGSVEDTMELTLEAGENKTGKFFWEAQAGSYLIKVASEDEEDTVSVNGIEAESALPGVPGFTSFLLVLATIFAVVIYHKKKR